MVSWGASSSHRNGSKKHREWVVMGAALHGSNSPPGLKHLFAIILRTISSLNLMFLYQGSLHPITHQRRCIKAALLASMELLWRSTQLQSSWLFWAVPTSSSAFLTSSPFFHRFWPQAYSLVSLTLVHLHPGVCLPGVIPQDRSIYEGRGRV